MSEGDYYTVSQAAKIVELSRSTALTLSAPSSEASFVTCGPLRSTRKSRRAYSCSMTSGWDVGMTSLQRKGVTGCGSWRSN
jgi:hypothetical protein